MSACTPAGQQPAAPRLTVSTAEIPGGPQGAQYVLVEVPRSCGPEDLAAALRGGDGHASNKTISSVLGRCFPAAKALARATQMVEANKCTVDVMFHGPAPTPVERAAGKTRPWVLYVRLDPSAAAAPS